ncbi:MAG: hypothetical protein ACRDIY_23905, partial [Chloroflexota bacterium]
VQSRAARYGWQAPTRLPDVRRLDRVAPEAANRLLGEALFDLVAFARRVDVDPEEALRQATNRFVERLEDVVEALRATDPGFDAQSTEERARRVNQALAGKRTGRPAVNPADH